MSADHTRDDRPQHQRSHSRRCSSRLATVRHRSQARPFAVGRVGLEATAAGRVAGGSHAREVCGGERRRVGRGAFGGGPPVAGEEHGSLALGRL